jgi:hypothetical protein
MSGISASLYDYSSDSDLSNSEYRYLKDLEFVAGELQGLEVLPSGLIALVEGRTIDVPGFLYQMLLSLQNQDVIIANIGGKIRVGRST